VLRLHRGAARPVVSCRPLLFHKRKSVHPGPRKPGRRAIRDWKATPINLLRVGHGNEGPRPDVGPVPDADNAVPARGSQFCCRGLKVTGKDLVGKVLAGQQELARRSCPRA